MKTLTQKELNVLLEKHVEWLNNMPDGQRFNLKNVDLSGLDLSNASLYKAVLLNAVLNNTNLKGADLSYAYLNIYSAKFADFSNANLKGADLTKADLNYAILKEANLYRANLSLADFQNADLQGADLNDACLFRTDLRKANLSYASLISSNLRAFLNGADLQGADLHDASLDKKEEIRRGITLEKSMIGYKKCSGNRIVKLRIPKGAIVFSINNTDCRTNKVKVISITDSEGNSYEEAISVYDSKFIYKVGDVIKPDSFSLMYNVDCTSGIHFFKTKEEAEKYYF